MSQIKFKRGDTFTLTCTYKVNGSASSVSNIDIASQLRDKRGNLIQDFAVTKLVSTGSFTLVATATETNYWPISILQCDVQFSEGGIIRSTQTFDVAVVEDITK